MGAEAQVKIATVPSHGVLAAERSLSLEKLRDDWFFCFYSSLVSWNVLEGNPCYMMMRGGTALIW